MRTLEKLGPNMDQKIKKDPRGTQVPTGHTKNLEYPEFLTAPLKVSDYIVNLIGKVPSVKSLLTGGKA